MISCKIPRKSQPLRVTDKKVESDLLLEVPPVLLVDEDEVEVISGAELLVHVAERRCEVKAAEEEAYRDGLPCALSL